MISRGATPFLASALLLATACGSTEPAPEAPEQPQRPAPEMRPAAPEPSAIPPHPLSSPDAGPAEAEGPGDGARVEPLAVVAFSRGKWKLAQEGRRIADELLDRLRAREDDWALAISGHASPSEGKPDKLARLSRQRAEAVADHLASSGVDRRRLVVSAHGGGCPAVLTNDPRMEGQNRRVELRLLDARPAPTPPAGCPQ